MSCDCNALSNQLNQINGKIDALIRENNQLKAQVSSKADISQVKSIKDDVKKEAFEITRDWVLGKGLDKIAGGVFKLNLGATNALVTAAVQPALQAIPEVLSRVAFLREQMAKAPTKEEYLKLGNELKDIEFRAAKRVNAVEGKVSRFSETLEKTRSSFNGISRKIDVASDKLNSLERSFTSRINNALKPFTSKIDNLVNSNNALGKSIRGLQSGFGYVNGMITKLAPLLAVVGLIASIAALAVSIGSIRVLGNRIDVLENGLNQQANALSKIYSIITPIKFKVDKLSNISPNLQFEFDKLVRNVNSMNKDLSLAINNLQLADKAFMTKSAVQALVNTTIATATSVIVGSAVGAIISRFPRITNIPTSGTNTVTNNTRIIERQPIIQPTIIRERNTVNNTFREIRTNTVTNNNSSNNSGANIDYGRIQNIVSSESNSTRNTVRSEHQVTRGLLGGIRQNVAATRTRLNNVAPPILRSDISQAVSQATKPIFDGVADIRKKTASIYQNQFIQSAMSTLNTAILVHNAMRLSFDAGQFVADSLGAVLNLTGIKFRDENQNEISLSQAVGGSIQGAINQIIPASMQSRIEDTWIRSSSIFSSAANVLWAVRNIGDELQNVTEITNDRLGLWMNTARDERLVSLDAYPHQPPISTGSPYGRYNSFLAKVNSKTESWENTVNNVEDAAGSVGYIASVPISVGSELQQIGENRTNIVNAVAPVQNQKQVELDEQLIDNEAPETLDSPIPYSDSVE